MTPRLVSVNVGMPADVPWRGRTVHTGIYKTPVSGPVMVRRLNVDGDGQGDLNGHGGEQRAVMVYQLESYDCWKRHLGRDDLTPGMFGENFTITGLADDEVCIGDRYRIGEAEFEVTQPRVTCFRVGMRLGEPDMPNMLVAHRRPGFYLRVITEGRVTPNDVIERTRRGRHELTVADIDALLYLPGRDAAMLAKAVDVPALSPGWKQSFAEMLVAPDGLAGIEPGWPGFRRLRVVGTRRESPDVLSIEFESDDGAALPQPRPGQYLTLRIPEAGNPVPLRSYSLSGDIAAGRYRISVKREEHGLVSRWLHRNAEAGAVVEVAAPRGVFCLGDDAGPVVLVSAGIGVTPVLAMLHALAGQRSERRIHWLHITRDERSLAFGPEVSALIESLPHADSRIFYTADTGRPDAQVIADLHLPLDAHVYLCGPDQFMAGIRRVLQGAGIDAARIHTELFGALPPINPGVVDASRRAPHEPDGPAGSGPAVSFSRSGITANWSTQYGSLLELAEACDVPTRFSCRSGVCHTCVTPVIAGEAVYNANPLEPPAEGKVLICVAQPRESLVLDL
ncbi:MOSC and FAD-binding oxidoreductase domain-containing protein [Mycolicibacterium sp. 120270]|uniref:MOSC and FAD-binding oxidoreductase domain-containing protein n=1 Tax=Mycolicibacterium sp. 120270 TaxID=3090600 RepID=UPI00299EFDCC|nr:MOSC and FAD-binding oxidoreductase domain-containing protein [Mycolicibacterium sp. 120270]MDX1882837.1 MOSC and FAD-binding oxidoreductase domain-containing protein [Mycolicibacterium sp. 120270]